MIVKPVLPLMVTRCSRLAIAAVSVAFLWVVPGAHAFSLTHGEGVTVTGSLVAGPVRTTLKLSPGEHTLLKINVLNAMGKDIAVEFVPRDGEPSPDPTALVKIVDGAQYGAETWLKPETKTVAMGPGDSLVQNVAVDVPVSAGPGSHYSILTIRTADLPGTGEKKGSHVQTVLSIGLEIFVDVAGGSTVSGKVLEAHTNGRVIQHGGFVSYGVKYGNNGTVTDVAKGDITVRSLLGNVVKKLPLPETIILRSGTRDLHAVWTDPPWIGMFSSTVHMYDGTGKAHVKKLPPVYVIPPWYYDIGVLIALAIAIGAWWRRRRAGRRQHPGVDGEFP